VSIQNTLVIVLVALVAVASAQGCCGGAEETLPPPPVEAPPPESPPPVESATPHVVPPPSPPQPTWIAVPGGTFLMGSEDGYGRERPVHEVTVAPFEMTRSEITVAQYMRCVEARGCRKPDWEHGTCFVDAGSYRGPLSEKSRLPDQPVVCVIWHQARDYAEWIGGRLPSEAEWEWAALGGKDPADVDGVDDSTCWNRRYEGLCTVESGEPNGYGLHDMTGSVQEWMADCYHPTYEGAPADGSAWDSDCPDESRSFRSGTWATSNPRRMRPTFRHGDDPYLLHDHRGFRVVRDGGSES
jgi:formylglycine-generating enzyme required for sulfatase activity